jgi:cytochrome c-type biogenesis protein CcmF
VASSVHAFEDSGLIPWFVVFMVVMLVLAVAVLVWRRALLRSATTTGSLVDEPGTFLYANIILSVLTFVILWGVVFPPIANAVSSSTIEFSTDFFNLVSAPLGLLLMAVLVVCMLARVRRGSWRRFTIDIAIAVGVGIVVLAVLLALGVTEPFPVAAFALSATAIAAVVIATLRTGLGWKRRRSYGAMLIHLGLAILIIGVAGSWAYKTTTDGQLAPGQTLTLGGAQVTLVQIDESQGADRETTSAVLDLTLDGKPAGRLVPRLEYYPASDQNWTRVAMRSSVTGDIYVLLQGADAEQNTVSVELESHPLIVWLWVGGAVMALGGLVALVLGRRPAGPKGPAAGGAGSKGASSRKQAARH